MRIGNENIESICSLLLGQEILWLIMPPCEYDNKSNTYWLEEDQGTREDETWKTQLMLHLKESEDKVIIGLKRRRFKKDGISYNLYSVQYKVNEQLEVLKKRKEYSPVNVISKLNFTISEIEIWNQKANLVNSYINDDLTRADTIILKSEDKRQILIQVLESDDQENCIKLKIMDKLVEELELHKKYELELIYKC